MKRSNAYGRRLSKMHRTERLLARAVHFEVIGTHVSAADPSRRPLLICANPIGGGGITDEKIREQAIKLAGSRV